MGEALFIHSSVKSGSQMLKLVRWLISFYKYRRYSVTITLQIEKFPQLCAYWSWCPMKNQILIWNNDPSTSPNVTSRLENGAGLAWPATWTFPLTAHAPRKRSIVWVCECVSESVCPWTCCHIARRTMNGWLWNFACMSSTMMPTMCQILMMTQWPNYIFKMF